MTRYSRTRHYQWRDWEWL